MSPLITISARAASKIGKLLGKASTRTVLFYAEGGGCNGMRYKLEPVDVLDDRDEVVKLENGAKVAVCHKSLLFLVGTEIDWEEGFMGNTFSFKNPNTTGTCGCGQTFSPGIKN